MKADDLKHGQKVTWKGKVYTVGNTYHNLVELYKDGKFVVIVNVKQIK
jgi:hypothetical protein